MKLFEFKNLKFFDERDFIKAKFLKYFSFTIPTKDFEELGKFNIDNQRLIFEKESIDLEKRFNQLIAIGFANLKGFYDKDAIYVHKNSGIPLIGNLVFGIIDRGTDALELKPITNCNLDCIFCSVDEGKSSKKIVDFVVESDYLVSETKKLIEFKDVNTSLHINPHGEPLLYSDLVNLVGSLRKIKNTGLIVVYTNGILLNKNLIDDLADAGLDRLSISIHSFDAEKSKELTGTNYELNHILEMIDYAKNKNKLEVILSPVYIPKYNEKDIEELIKFAKENEIKITIQNFLNYRFGRNPTKQISFKKFFDKLDFWEKKYAINLRADKDPDFKINKTKQLPGPFKTNQVINAKIVSYGRYKSERLAALEERTILVQNCNLNIKEEIEIKITRSKNNIYIGCLNNKNRNRHKNLKYIKKYIK